MTCLDMFKNRIKSHQILEVSDKSRHVYKWVSRLTRNDMIVSNGIKNWWIASIRIRGFRNSRQVITLIEILWALLALKG